MTPAVGLPMREFKDSDPSRFARASGLRRAEMAARSRVRALGCRLICMLPVFIAAFRKI
jgi:hypothetical protein